MLLDTPKPLPLEIRRARVVDEWIDYNGHMNEGYYAVAFGDASDEYLIRAGFDEDYRRRHRGTFYTVESHIRYLRELKAGDPILFRTTVLGVEARKLHLYHSMVHEGEGYEAATQEVFLLHVGLDDVAVTPMAPDLLAALERDRDQHGSSTPDGVGSAIRPLGDKS